MCEKISRHKRHVEGSLCSADTAIFNWENFELPRHLPLFFHMTSSNLSNPDIFVIIVTFLDSLSSYNYYTASSN